MASVTGTITYPAGVATWVRDCADLQGCKITVNGVSYSCNYCGDFAVYYVGKKGGWNSFLFEGICKRTDKLTDYKYNRVVDNTSINFEDNKYLVELNPSYELRTGWLTDEQAEKFASELISTPKMYLHKLVENEIVPAMVMNSTSEYKTFENTGRRLVQYTITVQESHTYFRR